MIYLLWRLFSLFIGEEGLLIEDRIWPWLSIQWEYLNDFLRAVLLYSGKFILNLLGYESYVYGNYILHIAPHPGVSVGNYCLAIQLMVLYVALVISLKTSWQVKLISIPLGIFVIQALNVLRIAAIALVLVYRPQYADMFHDYFFNYFILGVIVLMYWKILDYKV